MPDIPNTYLTYIDNNTSSVIYSPQDLDGVEVTIGVATSTQNLDSSGIVPCTYTGGWTVNASWGEVDITLPSEDAIKEIKKYCEGKLKADTEPQAEVILEIIRKYGF